MSTSTPDSSDKLAQRPPRVAALAGRGACVVEFDEPRGTQRLEVDRRVAAHGGRRPGRLQELAAGLDQVGRPGADLLRIADQQRRARGQLVRQQRQARSGAAPAAAPPCRRRECPRRAWPACRPRCRARVLADAGARRPVRRHARARRRSAAAPGTARRSRVSTSISGIERWSATENIRISDTSSPQNSTRTGCSAVGGKRSRMPPRTANSPRLPTMSTRV